MVFTTSMCLIPPQQYCITVLLCCLPKFLVSKTLWSIFNYSCQITTTQMGHSPILVSRKQLSFLSQDTGKTHVEISQNFCWKATRQNSLRTWDLTGFGHCNLKGGVLETHATKGICHVCVKSYVRALKSRVEYQLQLIGLSGYEGNSLFSN
jgi:hypothetical protein